MKHVDGTLDKEFAMRVIAGANEMGRLSQVAPGIIIVEDDLFIHFDSNIYRRRDLRPPALCSPARYNLGTIDPGSFQPALTDRSQFEDACRGLERIDGGEMEWFNVPVQVPRYENLR